jgi:amino acid transporter
MDNNPDRELESGSQDQTINGGPRRQSFKVAGTGIGNKSSQNDPATAALEQSTDFPVEKVQSRPLLEKSPEEQINGKDFQEKKLKGRRPGDRYIRLTRPSIAPNQVWEGRDLYVKVDTSIPASGFGKFYQRAKRVMIGKPIPTAHSIHERLTKTKALAIYSSDALSSVAYATEQILIVLTLAGTGAISFSIPVAFAITILLVVVGSSYRQTIYAYPKGGGSYIVAKDNLGVTFGLIAATSLMIGYIMTVAVSVSAGGAAVISALPALQPYLIPMCLFFVVLLTVGNLRGVRESGALFSAPTYLFIGTVMLLIVLGLLDAFLGIRLFEGVAKPQPPVHVAETLSILLVLRAFAQGCAAMTGVEAISDGVPAFKSPESRNAARTLSTLIIILAIMFVGITFLANHYKVLPQESHEPGYESVTSQLAHHIVGNSPIYGIFQLATCLILILGANTAFADFPRLTWFLARDKFLPHLFSHQGDRLAFSTGIITLAVLAGILIYFFKANVETLVPLYAIGVFTSFTLSQSGMVVRWWRLRTPGWQRSFLLNLLGAVTTSVVLVILALTQLVNGAWVVVVLVPMFYMLFVTINRYYVKVKAEISLEGGHVTPLPLRHHTVVVPIGELNQVTLRTLNYAQTLSDDVTAVHVNDNLEDIAALREKWDELKIETPLVVVETPYRSIIGPLLTYIDLVDRRRDDDTITVVIPEFVATSWWQHLLHNQTALRMKGALLLRPGIVVTSVPYHHH